MTKYQITERGVFGQSGAELAVGSVVEFDTLPIFLVGKCTQLIAEPALELVVATPEKTEPAETEEQRLRREYHELTGQHIGGNASMETVRKKHAEATEAARGE